MIERSHSLPLSRQARELGISRGSIYYLPKPVSPADLAIMRRIDELHLEFPFAGSRMLRDLLRQEGVKIGRQHVATLMKKMAIEAIYRRPNTSKPAPGHKIYPYLLRKLAIVRPNQVWATDISYIPMAKGFVSIRRDPGHPGCLAPASPVQDQLGMVGGIRSEWVGSIVGIRSSRSSRANRSRNRLSWTGRGLNRVRSSPSACTVK